jgi:hypothetical protein
VLSLNLAQQIPKPLIGTDVAAASWNTMLFREAPMTLNHFQAVAVSR